MIFARLPVMLLLTVLAGACSNGDSKVYHDQFFAFGTLIDVTFYDTEPDLAVQASETIAGDFQTLHRQWHARSALNSRTTAPGRHVPMRVSPIE